MDFFVACPGGFFVDREEDEGDEGNACYPISFKAVGAWSDGVAGVVTGAVGYDPWIAGIVFLDVENDLHEVGADVGDLGEDATGDTQGGGAEAFTHGEPDKAGTGVFGWEEKEDAEHEEEFDADEHHADAHAGLEGDGVDGIGQTLEACESSAGVGEGVDTNAEPSNTIAAQNADDAEKNNDGNLSGGFLEQPAEIHDNDSSDDGPKYGDKFALVDEVGFAGFVNEFGDFQHAGVDWHGFEFFVDHDAEIEAGSANQQSAVEECFTGETEESGVIEIWKHQVRFADMLSSFWVRCDFAHSHCFSRGRSTRWLA